MSHWLFGRAACCVDTAPERNASDVNAAYMARTGASECVQFCNSCMNDNSNYRQRYNDSTKSIDNQTSVNHGRWQAGANEPIDHLILRSIVECAQAGGGVQRVRSRHDQYVN